MRGIIGGWGWGSLLRLVVGLLVVVCYNLHILYILVLICNLDNIGKPFLTST